MLVYIRGNTFFFSKCPIFKEIDVAQESVNPGSSRPESGNPTKSRNLIKKLKSIEISIFISSSTKLEVLDLFPF